MIHIEFEYQGSIVTIQAQADEKIDEICNKFINRAGIDKTNLNYLYSGKTLSQDLTLNQTINNYDKGRNKMRVMVIENESNIEEKYLIKSPNLICPICKDTALFDVKNHKIKIYNCKKGHLTDNLFLSEFENTQIIDESKIICDKCKYNHKGIVYNREMYFCCICLMTLCPLCKSSHKNHKIINYENKYYICDKHGKEFNSYCEDCKQDICILCENEHEKHKTISYGKLIPKEEIEVIKTLMPLAFNAFHVKMNMIIDRLNNIVKNFKIYFDTMERMLVNYNINNINYNILKNIDNIVNIFQENSTNDIFKDMQDIVKDNSFQNLIPNVLNIYNELNINEIDLVYNIPKGKKEIGIFGEEFVKENKDLCKIIYENKVYDLSEYFSVENNTSNKLKFKLKGINNVTNLSDMFKLCSNLSDESDFSNWDTHYVNSMAELFYLCQFEKLPDISHFDKRNVVDMSYMFTYCRKLKSLPDISKWNTSKVSYMNHMFGNCSSLKYLPDLDKWDITNVKKCKENETIFEGCDESLNIPEKFSEYK